MIPPVDDTAPRVTLALPQADVADLRSRGLRFSLSVDEACRITSELLLDRRLARQLGIATARQVRIGSGSATAAGPGEVEVTINLTRRAKAKLRRLRGKTLTLRATVIDNEGNRTTVSRRLRLKP